MELLDVFFGREPISEISPIDDRVAVYELQNRFQISFALNDLCHVLMGRKLPGRGVWVDNRKYRIPMGLIEGLKGLLRMFSVTDDLNWKCFADRFSGNWRQTSYAEIRRLRPKQGYCLTERGIKTLLSVLERNGVIERRSPWISFLNKRELHIRFRADRLIEILKDIPRARKAELDRKIEVKIEDATMDFKGRIKSSVYCSVPVIPPGITTFSTAEEKDSPAPALPGRTGFLFKKISPEADVVWEVLSRELFKSEELTESTLKLLERRVHAPILRQRLTMARLREYIEHQSLFFDASVWYLNTPNLEFFLMLWSRIWELTRRAMHANKSEEAKGELAGVTDGKDPERVKYEVRQAAIWLLQHLVRGPGRRPLEQAKMWMRSHTPAQILGAANFLGLPMNDWIAHYREALRKYAFEEPLMFARMSLGLPFLARWAGFDTSEQQELDLMAETAYWEKSRIANLA